MMSTTKRKRERERNTLLMVEKGCHLAMENSIDIVLEQQKQYVNI